MHIIWTLDMKNGPVCLEHDEEARRRWVFVGRHPYTTACREGARWDPSLDVCDHPAQQGTADQQIQYAAAEYAATQAWEVSGEANAAHDTHEHDVAKAQAYDQSVEDEHFRQLDWDAAIAENVYRRDHGHAPVPEHSDQDDQDPGERDHASEEEGIETDANTASFDESPHGKAAR